MDVRKRQLEIPSRDADVRDESDARSLFRGSEDATSHALASRFEGRSGLLVGAGVTIYGYVLAALVMVAMGLTLTTTPQLAPSVTWDGSVSQWFGTLRSGFLDWATAYGSRFGATGTILVVAGVVLVILAIARRWYEAGFLVAVLAIESSSTLTTSLFVSRPRPAMPHLDSAPPTSSFPSGHFAASIVLYIAIAMICSTFVRQRFLRIALWIIAVVIPIVVAASRVYRGMHHPSDIVGSVLVAVIALGFGLLATRTAWHLNHPAARAERQEARS